MIKGAGHVLLNTKKYLLDESIEGHYVHRMPSVFMRDGRIQGAIDKKNAADKRLQWSMSDWVGGEGNRVFYEDYPNVYDYGINTNPRIPGQVTSRPKRWRATVAVASTDATTRQHYGRFFDAGGSLYYGVDLKLYKATDGAAGVAATWANVAPTLEATNAFTAGCGDHENLYVSWWKDDGSGASAERLTGYSVDDGTTWRNLTTSETIDGTDTGEASKNAFFGMTIHDGRLFAWTGRRLFTYDVANLTGSNALAADQYRKVYDVGAEPAGRVFGNVFWADIVDCGTSVCFFQSVIGRTMVYQYKGGVTRPIWTKPGFTTKSIAYNGGNLYIAGTFSAGSGSSNPGHGAIYMIPLDSMREVFLKWVRKTVDTDLQMQVANGGAGDRVHFCAAHTGRIWTYDGDYNGFSMLDDLVGNNGSTQLTAAESDDGGGGTMAFTTNDHRISDVFAWGPFVYIGIYRPATSSETVNQILAYPNDEPAQRAKIAIDAELASPSCFLISPEHDFEFPNDVKLLLGFHVSFLVEDTATTSGLLANQEIRVQYALDDGQNPTWVTAGSTLISTTSLPTGGAQGRLYIALTSSALKFFRLRWRVIVGNNATNGVRCPIVYDVTPEAELCSLEEFYDLILRMKDETAQTRVSERGKKSNLLRDELISLRRDKTVFAFVDGYRYREAGRTATSVQVFIEELEDVIQRNAEGSMAVRLRVVPI